MRYQHRCLCPCRRTFDLQTLVVFLLFVTTCNSEPNHNCQPSSCGNLPNISFPFRLKTDPKDCGDPNYELSCENNQTVVYLNSKNYYVESIFYENYTLRLLDPGIGKNQCPPFSFHSLTYADLPRAYRSSMHYEARSPVNTPVLFINCSNRVDSSEYVDAAFCNEQAASSNSSQAGYWYALVGYEVKAADLDASCKLGMVGWVSSGFLTIGNTSFSSILDSLAHGFSLPWNNVLCHDCDARGGYCYLDDNNAVQCSDYCLVGIPAGAYNLQKFKCLLENLLYYFVLRHLLVWTACIILLAGLRFLCGLPCLFALLHYKYNQHHYLSIYDSIEDFLQGQGNLVPIRYKYRDIRRMTSNFKDKLGEGGYGSVFKGKLRSGIFVAVKLMNKSRASGQEFISEVATIGRIHHVNVVRLVGFCVEGSKRALVYEFMPNGSLEKYLFSGQEKPISLTYERMFEISLGVARGIDYLHKGCDRQILHFDIKPHNILLDENFTPKISDFGLAKLYPTQDSIVSLTAARGTLGYMAPELFYKNIGGVSYKADVYSYGMLLMEMAGKRKNLNPFVENLSQIYFPSWVYDQFSEGKEIEMVDASGGEKKMVKKMILVALWCIQMKPIDRPSMNKIVEMLEGDGEDLQMPPKPSLYPEESAAEGHKANTNEDEMPLMSGN